MKYFKAPLKFLNLLSYDGTLSLSNLAVWICIARIGFSTDSISPTEMGAFITVMVNYLHKRRETRRVVEKIEAQPLPEVESVNNKVESLSLDLSLMRSSIQPMIEKMEAQTEEARKAISELNLAKGFKR